jgi:hypothetical protein
LHPKLNVASDLVYQQQQANSHRSGKSTPPYTIAA